MPLNYSRGAEQRQFPLKFKEAGMKGTIKSAKSITDHPESLRITEKYHSVEMKPVKSLPIYQFKLYPCTEMNGVGVHVKPDSEILDHLEPGMEVDMKYYPKDSKHHISHLKTQIINIIRVLYGPFKGHFMVGLSITEQFFNSRTNI